MTVRVRFADLRSVTRSVTLDAPISATAILAEIAEELVRAVLADHPAREDHLAAGDLGVASRGALRACSWSCRSGLTTRSAAPAPRKGTARFVADRAVDAIRDRFGWEAVGYGSVALELARSVPDAFRELAEKEL